MNSVTHLSVLAGLTLLYSGIHSWLASHAVKTWLARRWPRLMPAYRLFYNFLAVVLLIPIVALLWGWPGEPLWQRPFVLRWLFDGIALFAVGAFVHSLRDYDLSLFGGLRQWRERAMPVVVAEPFRIGFWHRFVRHPWYFFALLLLWTRDFNAAQLLFYGLVTGYLVVGSQLEERKLVTEYGDAYRRYRVRVPGLIPSPWRRISALEAEALRRES